MTTDDYEQRVISLFVSVMDIVRARRNITRMEESLRRDTERAHVDKRIIDVLENEYERTLEEPDYKMRSVAWIREDIRRVDNGEEMQFWDGGSGERSRRGGEGMNEDGAQQQAPANPCLENGCTDIENCDEICEHQRLYSPAWLAQHDATITAQARIDARKEWEEEHTPKFHADHPDEFSPWYNVEMVANRVRVAKEQAAAAERERVINEVCKINIGDNICKKGKDCKSCAWESLRSQPEKQQYCKHLKWLTQVEGGGEYRCDLGNKTSDEWCYKKEQCGDYELVPECGACTGPDLLDVLEQFIKENQRDLNEEDGYEPPMLDVPPFMIIDVDDVMGKIAELRQRGNK